ncbi:MAG: glycosyltransferase [Actinomycetes bacterium]|jgi:glycosyltransferase involved in cell wall biosynthesis
MLSTFPPRLCGLATFAGALSDALERSALTVVRVAVDDVRTPAIGVDARLMNGRRSSVLGAAEVLSDCDVAIVQHEFGIFGGRDGDEVIELLDALTIPSIVVLHSVPAAPTDHQRRVLEAVCDAASQVVVMTFAAGDRLLSSYDVDPTPVVMVPHGATLPDRSDPPPHPSLGTGPLHLLTWGLLGRGKGIEHVVTALAELRDVRPRVRYTVAGATHPNVFASEGNRYRDSLMRRSWALGVAGSVDFDDRYRDVPALMRFVASCSAVVLPYDSRDQATSGVLVDAIAAGRPVVATAFPHAIEMLSDGAGIVVPHRDPAALAAAVRSLVDDPALLHEMSSRAQALAPDLSWDAVGARYVDLCAGLLSTAVGTVS